MRKYVDNRPKRVRCPHCGKFMFQSFAGGSDERTLIFKHLCEDGKIAESTFSARYIHKLGSYGLSWSRSNRDVRRPRVTSEIARPKLAPVFRANSICEGDKLAEALNTAIQQECFGGATCFTTVTAIDFSQDATGAISIHSTFVTEVLK